MQEKDKQSIGLTPANKQLLDRLNEEKGLFEQDTHAVKFACALAIRRGVAPGMAEGTVTAWAVNNFDADGSMKSLVSKLYNTDTPYRLIEYLIHVGLGMIADEMDHAGNIDFEKLLAPQGE